MSDEFTSPDEPVSATDDTLTQPDQLSATTGNGRDSFATRLYRGEVSYDFIGRRRWWYSGSAAVVLIGIVAIIVLGLNPSIDFKGGATFQGPRNGHTLSDVVSAVESTGVNVESQQTTGSGTSHGFLVETNTLTQVQITSIEKALETHLGITANQLDSSTVGSTWGSQITHKAIVGLIVFLIAVIIYLSVRFEWRMALAAIIALLHDLVITAGIYALAGLEVSPSTVIALLTILGYSLYDTVVVFDKVRENSQGITGGSRMTFSEAANLAVNQTLVRSINTSIIALLPVIGLLVIGAGFLGAGSLKDLSFALLIGLAAGAYSSIFIATPLVCELKEREPAYEQLARRVAARRGRDGQPPAAPMPATVGAPLAAAGGSVPADGMTAPAASQPRPDRSARRGSQRRNRGSRPGGRGAKSRKRR